MSDAVSQPFPIQPEDDSTTPGGKKETHWKVVARTAGLTPAEIIAGRLHAEGIPARTWQEGAGRALGLTVGLLGTGYVVVPESYAAQAQDILAQAEDEFEADDAWEFDEEE